MMVSDLIKKNTHSLINWVLLIFLGVLIAFTTGLLGSIGQGVIKPSGLGIAIILHGLIGFAIALLPFFLGVGFLGNIRKMVGLTISARILIGFPLGLALAFICVATLISMKYGWILAATILLLATSGWMQSSTYRQQVARYLKLAIMVFPFGLFLTSWAALYWHGPYNGSDGHSSGDMVFYTTSIKLLLAYGLPLAQLGLEGEIAGFGTYFINLLFPVLGAGISKFIAIDPSLFLICSTMMTYVVGISVVVVAFRDDICSEGLQTPVLILLVLAILAAGRYPFWLVESPPVSHALILTICIVWLAIKSEKNPVFSAVGFVSAILGSALTKVVTFGVLVPLSLTHSMPLIKRASLRVRIALFFLATIASIYCLVMLAKYLPLIISTGRFGSETLLYVITDGIHLRTGIVYVMRDLSALILIAGWFRMLKLPMALALSIGALSFLVNVFLFQINHGVILLSTAMLIVANPARLSAAPVMVFIGIIFALPAFLTSDPTGITAPVAWLIAIGGAFSCILIFLKSSEKDSYLSKIAFRLSFVAMIGAILLAISIERGLLRFESPRSNLIQASAVDVWKQVRLRTDRNVLVFTDQTSSTGWEMLGGWNNFSLSGERQIYVANWVQTSLRSNSKRRQEVFATNDAVLSGVLSPDNVLTSRTYSGFVSVVRRQRKMPASWLPVYHNEDWAIYQWAPN
jgi:hypothetical protein